MEPTETVQIFIGFSVTDDSTPTWPEAKRGAVSDKHLRETREQLHQNLIWWPCSWCGREVLVFTQGRTREKCKCGAVRCYSHGAEGWRKDGKEMLFA